MYAKLKCKSYLHHNLHPPPFPLPPTSVIVEHVRFTSASRFMSDDMDEVVRKIASNNRKPQ